MDVKTKAYLKLKFLKVIPLIMLMIIIVYGVWYTLPRTLGIHIPNIVYGVIIVIVGNQINSILTKRFKAKTS